MCVATQLCSLFCWRTAPSLSLLASQMIRTGWFFLKCLISVIFFIPFFSRRFSSERAPTITVASFFFFFVRLQSHSDWSTLLTIETTKTTKAIKAMSGQRKLVQKGPPFLFLLFKRNLKNRTRLKGPPFPFFWHCATFFETFLMSQKSPPFEFFDILQQNIC